MNMIFIYSQSAVFIQISPKFTILFLLIQNFLINQIISNVWNTFSFSNTKDHIVFKYFCCTQYLIAKRNLLCVHNSIVRSKHVFLVYYDLPNFRIINIKILFLIRQLLHLKVPLIRWERVLIKSPLFSKDSSRRCFVINTQKYAICDWIIFWNKMTVLRGFFWKVMNKWFWWNVIYVVSIKEVPTKRVRGFFLFHKSFKSSQFKTSW